jgi:hypothetical protein
MCDEMGTFRVDIEIENPASVRPMRWSSRSRAISSCCGSRTLDGFNLRVDPSAKRLVDAGPAPAAAVNAEVH